MELEHLAPSPSLLPRSLRCRWQQPRTNTQWTRKNAIHDILSHMFVYLSVMLCFVSLLKLCVPSSRLSHSRLQTIHALGKVGDLTDANLRVLLGIQRSATHEQVDIGTPLRIHCAARHVSGKTSLSFLPSLSSPQATPPLLQK